MRTRRIIILGAGRFGAHLGSKLSEYGCEVVVVDRDSDRVQELSEDGFHALEADVEDENALRELGVAEADVVVVSIGENMQGSILATLALKQLKAKEIIARALDAKHAQVLERVGADHVVLPSRDMAYRLAERLRDDAGGDRLQISGEYQLAQVRLGSALQGQTLAEAKVRERYRINIVLVTRPGPDETMQQIEPQPDLKLEFHDICTIVGHRESINRFEQDCSSRE